MQVLPARGWIPLIVILASGFLLQFAGVGGAIALAQDGKEGRESQGAGKGFNKEILAVLNLKATGAQDSMALAANIRLREELLRSGYFILVERQRLQQVLDEQEREQVDCLTSDCNIAAGKITGARIILTGEFIQLSEKTWQISAVMADVETGETLRAESIYFEGGAGDLIAKGLARLTDKLIPAGDPEKFGGVIPLLLQKPVSPAQGEKTAKEGEDKEEETRENQGEDESRLRLWGSPRSVLVYSIYDQNIDQLETLIGTGISLGMEWEIEKSWGYGGSIHIGNMKAREDFTDPSTDEIEVSGSYYAWSLSIFDAVPNGHPWFFYGTGLMGVSMEYTDSGGDKVADLLGALLMFRFMYTFDSGVVLGYAQEFNLLTFRSDGTRIDELKDAGYGVDSDAFGGTGYIMIGYTF